ncbi:RING-H2 finger protein ATL13 [Senna tora]|uniref:RING-H2 finger protein ATL13 n=1 Tax=Senna tora TaxID=362788 RepID=A0A835CCZ4_9FABA|nr:RING-H2 finger protein ATL13 [Senna tora]
MILLLSVLDTTMGSSVILYKKPEEVVHGILCLCDDENSSLQVTISNTIKKQASRKLALPLTLEHRSAMSECESKFTRDFRFTRFDATRIAQGSGIGTAGAAMGRIIDECFSISKIWIWRN